LRGALLAMQDEDGIRPPGAERREEPGDKEPVVPVIRDVEEGAEIVERAARKRYGQREHAAGAPEFDRGPRDDPPAPSRNLDGAPRAVAEVEVDRVVVLGEARKDVPLGPVEERRAREHAEGGLDDVGAREPAGRLIGA